MNIKPTTLSPKIILSCFLASTLEIYDFAIFGFLNDILHKKYLSFLDPGLATITTYAFFSIGFLFRPIGSLIFGYIGDVYGRKAALVTSVSMMGFASMMMFLLPTFEMIGITACFIIVLVRIVQGISVGGEFTGAIIFAVEHSKQNRAGLIAGIMSAGGACGVLLANLVSKIVQHPLMPDFGWRFAFLLGFTLSVIGFFIRKNISDSPLFIKPKSTQIPLFEGLKQFKTECFATLCVAAANGTTFYFGSVYLYKLIGNIRNDDDFSYIPLMVSSLVAIMLPLFGVVSDRLNRKLFLTVSSLILGMYISCFMPTMLQGDIKILYLSVVLYSILTAMMIGSINIFAVEIFPIAYRMSCSSLFYSLGMGFVGGTIPMVASFIIQHVSNSTEYIAYYIGFICLMASIGTFMVYIKNYINVVRS